MNVRESGYLLRLLVIFYLLVLSPQVFALPQYKTYVHAGFLDHKTGTSLVGYAHSVHQTSQNDFFIRDLLVLNEMLSLENPITDSC